MSIVAIKVSIFVVVSAAIIWISRKSLAKPRSHGFFRFFAFESILVLLLFNIDYWFVEPLSEVHILSWILLICSAYTVIHGTVQLKRVGRPNKSRTDPELIGIEKTTELVTSGIYKYIRHPMYASLLFLAWGTLLKRADFYLILLAILASIMLYLTARAEEKENIAFFGEAYRDYMKRTRMFIPYLF